MYNSSIPKIVAFLNKYKCSQKLTKKVGASKTKIETLMLNLLKTKVLYYFKELSVL